MAEVAAHDRGDGLLNAVDACEQRAADEQGADEAGHRRGTATGCGETVPEALLDGREAMDSRALRAGGSRQGNAVRTIATVFCPSPSVTGRV